MKATTLHVVATSQALLLRAEPIVRGAEVTSTGVFRGKAQEAENGPLLRVLAQGILLL